MLVVKIKMEREVFIISGGQIVFFQKKIERIYLTLSGDVQFIVVWDCTKHLMISFASQFRPKKNAQIN